jgi:hypothetical protein
MLVQSLVRELSGEASGEGEGKSELESVTYFVNLLLTQSIILVVRSNVKAITIEEGCDRRCHSKLIHILSSPLTCHPSSKGFVIRILGLDYTVAKHVLEFNQLLLYETKPM